MSKLILLIVSAFYVSTVFAQVPIADESQALNQKVAELYKQGKFDEAIPIAEAVVTNEKKKAKSSETHAIALMNLGMLHKGRLILLLKQNETPRPGSDLANRLNDASRNAEKNLRESLEIYYKIGEAEVLSAALLKSELAWVLHSYFPSPLSGGPRERIDEAEKLYTESLAKMEKISGPDSDTTLKSVLGFGDFYMRWINFEKALPFYERYIETIEKRDGTSSKALVPALRATGELLVITDRVKDADILTKRISEITGKPEPLPVTSPRLALRGRKIESVKRPKFNPPDFFENPGFLVYYPYSASQITVIGQFKIKQIAVNILVDESGNVVEANVSDKSVKDIAEIEKAARNSKFRPFSYKGESRKMRGTLIYPYYEN